MSNIVINITLAQGNLILEGLSERPFKQVFELIGYLNQRASIVLPAGSPADAVGTFELSKSQMRLITEVLGEMPFNRVHRLIQQLHHQLSEAQADAG